MLVVDASVLAAALVDDGADGDRSRARLSGLSLAAPELIALEVSSVVRGLVRAGKIDQRRAELALVDLHDLPIELASPRPLIARCWELRDNLTIYDAAYVALAELLAVSLLTADARIAKAPGINCDVEVLS